MTELKRTIRWPQLMLYGIGSMLGAGIYGLVGKAAGVMGGAVWVAFLVAMIAALLTAISYASIASRYPKAGGAAYVSYRAYRKPWLSYVVGLTVLCSGLSSIATQSKVVASNLNSLIGFEWGFTILGTEAEIVLLAVAFLLAVAGIVFRGITESLWANAVCTAMEVSGLLLVIVVGCQYWGSVDLLEVPPSPDGAVSGLTLALVMQGAVLTFFSFIGFEDMLNVAEEVENPNRTMPIAVIGAMLAASAIYIMVAITAVSVVPWPELAEAPAPLKHVIEIAAPWFPPVGFVIITIAAVANTALVNMVMGSRLLYGMSQQGLLPPAVGKVHGTRRTPHIAILIILGIVVSLQFAGNIEQLASATVLLLLTVFMLVNGALVVLQHREGNHPNCFNVPMFVPILGSLICAVMIVARISDGDARAPTIAAVLIGGIVVLYWLTARKNAAAVAKFAEEN